MTWPIGVDRIILDEVESTMIEAAERVPDLTKPTWIMAHRQSAARGRRGRVWENPTGNLAATLVFKPDTTPQMAGLRAFTASLALYGALAELVDPKTLALKWPNDVLLSGGKVAGILLESASAGSKIDWLAIGFGVNVKARPEGDAHAAFPPISLAEMGVLDDAEAVLTRLAHHMDHWETQLTREGFGPIRAAWLARATRLGEVITARTTHDEITGVFETIDETGQLVLSSTKGQVAIPAGDVFF